MKTLLLTGFLISQILPVSNAVESLNRITFLGTNQFDLTQPEVAADYQYEIESFNLDAHRNMEMKLANDLPKDRKAAERIANERLAKIDEGQTIRMFQGTALLVQWDIKKLPAMVFGNGEYVIYGVTDTATAIKRYLNSRRR